MTEEFVNLRSRKNPKARIKLMGGHFATMNSHVNTNIDMSTVKTRHNNARETAATLAEEYKTGTMVETIVCLKNTEVIGAFMAEHLADTGRISMSAGNNISVVTPEFDTMGQILFRDSNQRMIEGKQVLILTDSVRPVLCLQKPWKQCCITVDVYVVSVQYSVRSTGQQVWMSGQSLRFLICRIIKDMQPKTARCAGRGRNWMELSIHSVL